LLSSLTSRGSLKSKMVLGDLPPRSYSGASLEQTMLASPSLSAISIRRATNNDAPEILACLRAAFAPYRDFYTPEGFLDTVLTPETLQDRLAHMQVFVAETSSGQIAGTIACQVIGQGEGHLRGMAVLPTCQGSGIAAQLLAHAEAELRRQNCTCITLDTTAPLERAMRFYEKCGFHRSGKIRDFFGMPLFEFHKRLSSKDASRKTSARMCS
jgi:ribosomal protein S18 acetylase RimI-like enzyme